MLERTRTRALPLLNTAADLSPAAQACCGACRTCMTTNAVGIVLAAGYAVVRVARRLTSRAPAPARTRAAAR